MTEPKQKPTGNPQRTGQPEKVKPLCFVISTIGKAGSPERKKANGILNAIIRPALEEWYRVERADDEHGAIELDEAMILKLYDAELVVAELSDYNTNVYYELAVRHCTYKPVIQMIEEGKELPWDLKKQNTVEYDPSLNGIEAATSAIRAMRGAVILGRTNNLVQRVLAGRRLLEAVRDDVGESRQITEGTVSRMFEYLQLELTDLRRALQDSRRPGEGNVMSQGGRWTFPFTPEVVRSAIQRAAHVRKLAIAHFSVPSISQTAGDGEPIECTIQVYATGKEFTILLEPNQIAEEESLYLVKEINRAVVRLAEERKRQMGTE